MYEFGKVYSTAEGTYQEDKKIALALCGRAHNEAWNSEDSTNDIYRLKGVLATLLESLGINGLKEERSKKISSAQGIELRLGKKIIAELGVVHQNPKSFSVEQEVVYAEMDLINCTQFAFKQDIEVAPIPNTLPRDEILHCWLMNTLRSKT